LLHWLPSAERSCCYWSVEDWTSPTGPSLSLGRVVSCVHGHSLGNVGVVSATLVPRFWQAVREYHSYTGRDVGDGRTGRLSWSRALELLAFNRHDRRVLEERRQPTNSDAFAFTLSLVLATTILLVPSYGPYNQVLLIPALLIALKQRRAIWQGSIASRVLFLMTRGSSSGLVSATACWTFFCCTAGNGRERLGASVLGRHPNSGGSGCADAGPLLSRVLSEDFCRASRGGIVVECFGAVSGFGCWADTGGAGEFRVHVDFVAFRRIERLSHRDLRAGSDQQTLSLNHTPYTWGARGSRPGDCRPAGIARACADRFRGREFYLIDLASKHGTFVNGEKVDRRKLARNDRLELARATSRT